MGDYDVVVDALQKHRDKLLEMINRNMSSEYITLNIMDDIRFDQIGQLDAAIAERKNKKEWVKLTEDEAFECKGRTYFETYKAIEAKLKDKNT